MEKPDVNGKTNLGLNHSKLEEETSEKNFLQNMKVIE